MRISPTDAVTGSFSYSGAAITNELTGRGRRVRTLTAHPQPVRAGTGPDEVHPVNFHDPDGLRSSLTGIDTLFNTYWVRFPRAGTDFTDAVDHSRTLLDAAAAAGVRRVVHLSITHADPRSSYPYFAGKGMVEAHLAEEPMSHAILRPAILFGGQAVLINNIAWLLRHLPVFAVGDGGNYRIRGIHIADLATLCADEAETDENVIRDAVGPERPTFRELIEHTRAAVRSRSVIVNVPGTLIPVCAAVLGPLMRDHVLTRDEYAAMAAGLADTTSPSTGRIAITEWITDNAGWLGRHYLNDTKGRAWRDP